MTDTTTAPSGWRRFWNKGGWWRALLAVVVYAIVYQVLPIVWSPLSIATGKDGLLASPASVFFGFGLPVIVGSLVLLVFAWSVGWLPKPLFTKQPVARRWWMWFAPVLVAIPIVLRVLGIDYGSYTTGVVITTLICGLFVGVAEELIFRGVVVTLMRKGGHGEWSVAAVSSLLFALMHSTNIFAGQAVLTVVFTLIYTFAFGVLMYLVMRVTGNLIWAILLHGLTDPTSFLATGGIDVAGATVNPLVALAGTMTWPLILGSFILLIFIRGRAYARTATASRDTTAPSAAPSR